MKTGLILDIIFGALLLPGMMFLFPVAEWIQWQPGAVVTYAAWLYAVWLLCRRFLGPQIHLGWRGVLNAGTVLFLVVSVTFLMSLSQVDIPETSEGMGSVALHQRAMWILLLAVLANGLPVGILSAEIKDLKEDREVKQAVSNAREALESRRAEAETGEEILVKSGYKTQHIPVSAIQFIEGRNNYACFHLDHREDVVTKLPLKDVLPLLPEGRFVRIHRSYIVPLWRIESSSLADVKLMGLEHPLPLGRAYKDCLKNNNG